MVNFSELWGKTPDTRSANKKMLLGGIASGLIYWGNVIARDQAGYPPEIKQQLDPHIPPYDELIAAAAPPGVLYSIVKFGKKDRFRDIADGSIYFGVPTLIARTVVQSMWAEGKALAPPAVRFTPASMSKYVPSNSIIRTIAPTSSLSKYAVTS
jgi:hypothetical protein